MEATTKIILAGGSGFLGQCLINNWGGGNIEWVILSRNTRPAQNGIRYVMWDGKNLNGWQKELDGAYAVINLTGRSVNCRYNAKNRAEILNSRVNATNAIGIAINRCKTPPKVWVNAASAAIYGNRGSEILTEQSAIGRGFSVDVCTAWEENFNDIIAPLTRKVLLRIGLVLGNGGGVLPEFKKLATMGFGGRQGKGQQYISWLHQTDFTRCMQFVLSNQNIEGAYNCCAPAAVTNTEFTKAVSAALKTPIALPMPAWTVKAGAIIKGTEAELILNGRRVYPQKLLNNGFTFLFTDINQAVQHVLNSQV